MKSVSNDDCFYGWIRIRIINRLWICTSANFCSYSGRQTIVHTNQKEYPYTKGLNSCQYEGSKDGFKKK